MKTIRNETYVRDKHGLLQYICKQLKWLYLSTIYLDCGDYGQVLLGNKEEVRRLYVCLEMQCN